MSLLDALIAFSYQRVMRSISIAAQAKINLRLKVIGKREDGYHLLSMLNEKLALADTIDITAEGEIFNCGYGCDFPIEVVCRQIPSLETESNLVVRAARRLAERYGRASALKIVIEKRLPIGAGLGGGSSDAAACLKALNLIWDIGLTMEELAAIGVTIGADLPFFFFDGPARVTGIGECVDTDVKLPKLWVLLVNPGFEVSTAWAYRSLGLKLTDRVEGDSFPQFFNNLDDLSKVIENDLEAVVASLHPEIDEIKRHLLGWGARCAFMSGSGPTVVGLFDSKEGRDEAYSCAVTKDWRVFSTEN